MFASGELFTGEYFDDSTQLQYNRARFYDPRIGRFPSADTYEGQLDEPATLHHYAFNHNNPPNRIDPSGNISLGELSISINGSTAFNTVSIHAGRRLVSRVLFGHPPKDVGIVGELILDWMTQGFFDHIYSGSITKQEFGQRVHKELRNKCLAYKPRNDVTIECEPFFDEKGKTKGNPSGSVGVDVLIRHRGTPVIAFELKTGKGMGKSGFAKRQKWIGTSVIQITFKSTKG